MNWRWPRWLRRRPSNVQYSIGDPATALHFGWGFPNYSGVEVTETSALTVSAFYRGVALIAGTIGTLPLRTLRDTGDGMRQRIGSFFDDPGAPVGLTQFNWAETVVTHLILHGDAFLKHIYGGAGQLLGLQPIHPSHVTVEWAPELPGGKRYITYLAGSDGTPTRREFDARTMTQVMGQSLYGLRGLSVLSMARNSLGTSIAGDRAAASMFDKGMLIAGFISPDDDLETDDQQTVKDQVTRVMSGYENAGSVPVLNRKVTFNPMSMNAKDAQFLESRAFGVREVARWLGVPPHLLYETTAASNWGTGIEEQNLGLSRFTLTPWTARIEQALSRLLPRPRFVEFDFAGLERGTPEDEINLLIAQVNAGLLTTNEGRAIRNLPPVAGGDVLRIQGIPINDGGVPPTPAEQAANDPQGVPANA